MGIEQETNRRLEDLRNKRNESLFEFKTWSVAHAISHFRVQKIDYISRRVVPLRLTLAKSINWDLQGNGHVLPLS